VAATADSKIRYCPDEHRAAGVTYTAIAGAPGLYFDCAPYHAKLSTTACAKRWREAQAAGGDTAARVEKCRGCPIGAQHADEAVVRYSVLYGSEICPRCGRGTGRRLIGGTRCISCYNRELEVRRGRNAKGTRPLKANLARRTLRYAVEGGGIETLTAEHSADLAELMLVALRKTRGRIYFAFSGQEPASTAAVARG